MMKKSSKIDTPEVPEAAPSPAPAAALPLLDGNQSDFASEISRKVEEAILERRQDQERRKAEKTARPAKPPTRESAKDSPLRKPPAGDNQHDFFVPVVTDISVKDAIELMDLAVFRLAKSSRRKGDIITHRLADVVIEVSSGPHGMATIYDYDIVLMMVSHLAKQTEKNRREGINDLPPRIFQPSMGDILKFTKSVSGGRQYMAIEKALDRLQGTQVKITQIGKAAKTRRSGYFPLIAGADVVSRTDTGKVDRLAISIPDWIYDAVTSHEKPAILTFDPDYFLLRGALARYLYRLARKAAGNSQAIYKFSTVYERSG
ncbi:MAG: replication initiator protein A [Alphaproteobacteria bacterium]|nr:replication initiator protein A [Alphaproteobacteria bacterium]